MLLRVIKCFVFAGLHWEENYIRVFACFLLGRFLVVFLNWYFRCIFVWVLLLGVF